MPIRYSIPLQAVRKIEDCPSALNVLAAAAPDWLRSMAAPDWHDRYDRRVEEMRLPETGPKRDAYVVQVGTDGYRLLDALAGAGAPADAAALPAVTMLRGVWERHFEQAGDGSDSQPSKGVRLRLVDGRGPGDHTESPYDVDARFRSKSGTSWTGYMARYLGHGPIPTPRPPVACPR